MGLNGIVWGSAALFALLVAVPFVDRGPERYWSKRPIATTIAIVVILAIIVLTVLMAATTPAQHLG